MGRIVKQLSAYSTKQYWYPGEKAEWIRAAVAIAAGGGVGALLMFFTRNSLLAVVAGSSATLAVAGFNLGRRDARALAGFPTATARAARRAAIAYSGPAAWRGAVRGVGAALAAVLVLNVANSGWIADWALPLVPGAVGALAHQMGMVWDRLGTTVSAPEAAEAIAAADGD